MEHQTSDFSQFSAFGILSVKESIQIANYCIVNDCWNCPLHGMDKCEKRLIAELSKHAKASLY